MLPQMYNRITISEALSRWWQGINTPGNDQAELLITSTIAGLALFLFLILLIKKSGKQNPPLPPGPKGLPLFGNLFSLDPELHTHFSTLAQTYGPIFALKLGKKIAIVITSPVIAKEVLKDQDITFANRDVTVAASEATYGGKDIAWTPHGPEWRMLRKVCVKDMLSNKTLDAVYGLRQKELRQTITYLYSQAGSPVNVGEQMFVNVLNVLTSMLWGGTLKGEERASLGKEFKQVVGEITAFFIMPNLSDFYPGLARFDLQGVQKKVNVLARRFDKIFDSVLDQRLRNRGGGSENKDFLEVLLQQIKNDQGDGKEKLTMTHVKALLLDMVVGGTDTISNLIEFALAEMMNKPEVLKKVQDELESVIGKDKIVEESDMNKLPYLNAVMKETLRLHTVLPLLIPHSPSETTIVAGYTIPKGSRIFINVWAVHRDPSIWENPLEFRPERFLNLEWDYSGNDFNYFPFGSGRRICVGISMAERMFIYSLASLVHSFDWSLPAGVKLDLADKFGIVLKKKIPLVIIPTPRLSNPTLYD